MENKQWDNVICDHGGDFMQSWGWGAFHEALGWRVERIRAGGLIAQMLFRPIVLSRREVYVPRGPIRTGEELEESIFWAALGEITDKNTLFFECDLLEPIPFFTSITHDTRQPQRAQIIDIAGKDKEELYKQFHTTLQQNIDRAKRYGLEVKKEDGWERFNRLYQRTMQRHKLRPWHVGYIRTLIETLAPEGMVEVWSVYHGDDLLATNLYTLFNKRATQVFAGSSSTKRSYQAPHFLHWLMMSTFAKRGINEYDLGKVDREKLPGLTRFKERFGGTTHTYPGNYKKILQPFQYGLYRAARQWIG